MHKTARQKYVLDIISEQGQASITELAEKLQVSAIPFAAISRTSKNKGWRRRTTEALSRSIFRP